MCWVLFVSEPRRETGVLTAGDWRSQLLTSGSLTHHVSGDCSTRRRRRTAAARLVLSASESSTPIESSSFETSSDTGCGSAGGLSGSVIPGVGAGPDSVTFVAGVELKSVGAESGALPAAMVFGVGALFGSVASESGVTVDVPEFDSAASPESSGFLTGTFSLISHDVNFLSCKYPFQRPNR